jgi:hypothetical protein
MKTPRIGPNSRLALAAFLVLTLGAALACSASAGMIIGNSGSVNTSGTPAADASPASKSSYVAAGFTINAGSNYTFSDAIAYGIESNGPGAGGTTYATGSLWLDGGRGPETLVENLTTESISGTTYTFDAESEITFTGGDTYWLVVTGTRQQLKWATSTETPSGPGATYDEAGQGQLSGSESDPTVASYSAGPGGVAGFEVDGTLVQSVPEPASVTLFALGLAGTAAAAIRRSRTA